MPVSTKTENGLERATVSKMAAVKEALKQLGKKAQPLIIQRFVKEQYDLTMSTAHISNYKSMILNGPAGKRKPGAKIDDNKVDYLRTGPGRPRRNGVAGITIPDIKTIKSMVSRVGADSLKTLIDLLED